MQNFIKMVPSPDKEQLIASLIFIFFFSKFLSYSCVFIQTSLLVFIQMSLNETVFAKIQNTNFKM